MAACFSAPRLPDGARHGLPPRGLSEGQLAVVSDTRPPPSATRSRSIPTTVHSPPTSPIRQIKKRSSVGLIDLLLPHPPLPGGPSSSGSRPSASASPPSEGRRRPALLVKRKTQNFGQSPPSQALLEPVRMAQSPISPTAGVRAGATFDRAPSSVWSALPASAPPVYTRFDPSSPERSSSSSSEDQGTPTPDTSLEVDRLGPSISVQDASDSSSPGPPQGAIRRGTPSALALEPPLSAHTPFFDGSGPLSPCFPSGSSYQGETPTVESSGQDSSPFFRLMAEGGELTPDREEMRAELGRWEKERIDWDRARQGISAHGQHDSISTTRGGPSALSGSSERARSTSPAAVATASVAGPSSAPCAQPRLRLSTAFSETTAEGLGESFYTPTSDCTPSPSPAAPPFAFPVRSSSLARRTTSAAASKGETDWERAFEAEREKSLALEEEVARLKRVVAILMNLDSARESA